MCTLDILDLGKIAYEKSYLIQKELLEKRIRQEIPDTLILCEHGPVITMGRSKHSESLLVEKEFLRQNGVDFFDVERGGDITYHCPGQLVGYPIFNLKESGRDVHKFLHDLEEIILLTLKEFGLEGTRGTGNAGIWINTGTIDKEIGFIGIALKKWVSYHGFSINVNSDLTPFSWISPCGIKGAEASSIESVLQEANKLDIKVTVDDIKRVIVKYFKAVFNLKVHL